MLHPSWCDHGMSWRKLFLAQLSQIVFSFWLPSYMYLGLFLNQHIPLWYIPVGWLVALGYRSSATVFSHDQIYPRDSFMLFIFHLGVLKTAVYTWLDIMTESKLPRKHRCWIQQQCWPESSRVSVDTLTAVGAVEVTSLEYPRVEAETMSWPRKDNTDGSFEVGWKPDCQPS